VVVGSSRMGSPFGRHHERASLFRTVGAGCCRRHGLAFLKSLPRLTAVD